MESLSALLQSFSNIAKPILDFIVWLFPLKIYSLHDGELGVIKTFGKVRRKKAERKPGITLCFCFEELERVQAIGGYVDFPPQTITTKDNQLIVVNGAVVYSIFSVKDSILCTEAIEDVVSGICMNRVRSYALTQTVDEFLDNEKITKELLSKINRSLKKHGTKVDDLMITDLRPHEVTYICNNLKILWRETNALLRGKK